jgi:hypothetical protein
MRLLWAACALAAALSTAQPAPAQILTFTGGHAGPTGPDSGTTINFTNGVFTSPNQLTPSGENWTVSNISLDLTNYTVDNTASNASIAGGSFVLTRPAGAGGGSVTFTILGGTTSLDGHAPEGGDLHTLMSLTSNSTSVSFGGIGSTWDLDLAMGQVVFNTGSPRWSVASGETASLAFTASAVPEPGSIALLGLVSVGFGAWRCRRGLSRT